MASSFGNNLKVTIFGQSHSEAIGVTIDGLPEGFEIDMEELQSFLDRRAPGKSSLSTQRKEPDKPEFLSGLADGITCGAPLTAIIKNKDVRSQDYDELDMIPRPGHADLTALIKHGGSQDFKGGGHFSGRLTAPLCIAGGIAIQMLKEEGITVDTKILEVGGESIDDSASLEEVISKAKAEGDSVGGIIECTIKGVPAGIGDPMFDGIENRLSQVIFGIPAIKGIEFGAGFAAARMKGSENNDQYYPDKEQGVITKTNNAGGILGGITNGNDIVFRVAVKPTPSIAKEQDSVNMETGEAVKLVVKGRHDPCIVPRALPCIEAAAAAVILDYLV